MTMLDWSKLGGVVLDLGKEKEVRGRCLMGGKERGRGDLGGLSDEKRRSSSFDD